MNRYTAIGNLTKDPICKDAGDSKVCNFSIAINEYHYNNGSKNQSTFFIDIECWNRQAENCTKFLSKGNKVAIEGKLKSNSWEKNGQKFSKFICVADRVHFLGQDDQGSPKPTKKEVEQSSKSLSTPTESVDEVLDDIDDIPF
jgi:single-strand DNA-binding protein